MIRYSVDRLAVQIVLAAHEGATKVGERRVVAFDLYRVVEPDGRVRWATEVLEAAINEAVQVAEEREGGG